MNSTPAYDRKQLPINDIEAAASKNGVPAASFTDLPDTPRSFQGLVGQPLALSIVVKLIFS